MARQFQLCGLVRSSRYPFRQNDLAACTNGQGCPLLILVTLPENPFEPVGMSIWDNTPDPESPESRNTVFLSRSSASIVGRDIDFIFSFVFFLFLSPPLGRLNRRLESLGPAHDRTGGGDTE
ncbi:MAG: hypothetical protein OXN16_02925 [Gammaproteobacteria bacterium]|nr:hypothetical protein [Gammaproteobacteria bacterium]